MACEERVGLALRLRELACGTARLATGRHHPEAAPRELEDLLRRRLEPARDL
jgi:hypothetical protein